MIRYRIPIPVPTRRCRNIFNVISGGFGTVQKVKVDGDSAPAGEHKETTSDLVAQKLLSAKVLRCVSCHLILVMLGRWAR